MEAPNETISATQKKSSFWKELFQYAAIAIIVIAPIRLWVAQPFIVRGGSMDNTFVDAQYLIVDELTYRFHDIERGDVVIFKYPLDPSKYFIKRIIGLPGETVKVESDTVTIIRAENPNGIVLNEPYISSRTFGDLTTTLGSEEYFVMGDNRMVSSDSRVWGALPKDDIIGRPIFRLLPINKINYLPGTAASSTILKQ